MKLIPFIVLTVLASGLKAQEPPACDTLVLRNKKVISVRLDSVKGDVVYYRHCPDDDGRIRSLPVSYLKTITGISPVMDTLPRDKGGEVILRSDRRPGQVWTFTPREEGQPILLPASQEVRVHFRENRIKRKRKGYMESMEGDSVVLQTKRFGRISIPKSVVTEISIPKSSGILGTTFGSIFLLFAFGLVASIAFIFSFVFLLTGGGSPDGDTKDASRTGCVVGLLLGVVGIALLLLSMPRSIQAPFSDRWEITESRGDTYPKNENTYQSQQP